MTHHDKALRDWIEVGPQGTTVVAGLGLRASFFYQVNEASLTFTRPGETLRQRLNASADELESILESRRQQSENFRAEKMGAERSDSELRAEYERIRAVGEREVQAEAARLRAEQQRLEQGETGPLARLRPKRAREQEVRQRIRFIIRRELGLSGYDFSRGDLERGLLEGVLTPGEQELLARMQERQARGEAKPIDRG